MFAVEVGPPGSGPDWLGKALDMIAGLVQLLADSTPLWLTIAVAAVCFSVLLRQRRILRRLDRHAESIANMDTWADSVEQSLSNLEEQAARLPVPFTPPQRLPSELRQWWPR